ncbi:DNA-directed RNA polymerase subunit D [Candidatus Pacearchaeota archaeon ex4484_26]|nr:MAG: DNA-directed RNA polymerase subunit D [Candidatus Pacearchaeota archaeon ex4484_26]
MKIQDVKKQENKLSFKIIDADLSFVNALRRIIIESVPVLAIDTVEFIKNDSVLYDEIIAHRLGLVPLKADIKTFKLREECSCHGKGCSKCSVKLKLKVKGREVLSTDLKGRGVESVYEMPIVNLRPDQELELIAEAKLGTGKEHAKFIPGLVWHTYDNENEITFFIESWGQLKPKEIFLSAIHVLEKKFKELDKIFVKL